jgi:CHAT domain-containing protein
VNSEVKDLIMVQVIEKYISRDNRVLLDEVILALDTELGNLSVDECDRYYQEVPGELYRQAQSIREKLELNDYLDIASCLVSLGDIWSDKATFLYTQALLIFEHIYGEHHIEISYLLNKLAGRYELKYKLYDHNLIAEQLRKRALIMQNEINASDDDISESAFELGCNLHNQGKFDEAEKYYQYAIEVGERCKQGKMLIWYRQTVGGLYLDMSEYEKAEDVFRAIYDKHDMLKGNLSSTLLYMGRFSESEEMLCTLLAGRENDCSKENILYPISHIYNDLGSLYELTGRYEESELHYRRALEYCTKKEYCDWDERTVFLSNISMINDKTGRHSEAEKICKNVLTIYEEELPFLLNTERVAHVICHYAIILSHCGRHEESIKQHYRALAMRENYFLQDHSSKILESVRELAHLYTKISLFKDAESFYFRALKIAEHIYEGKYHPDYSDTLHGLARLCHATNRKPAAIFWAKKAINVIQKIRENISGIKTEALRAFDNSVSSIYRELSDWLIDDGRLLEAQHVLSLLKEQECFEFVRRDASSASHVSEGLSYTEQEAAQAALYQSALQPLAELKSEQEALLANKQPTTTEKQRLAELENALEKAGADFNAALRKISEQLGSIRQDEFKNVQEAEGLMPALFELSELGGSTVAIYTVCCENALHTILITPTVRKSFSSPIGEKELNKKIFEFRSALLPDNGKFYDSQSLAEELYSIVVAPLANELKVLKVTTILWSLDGVLRYIPMNALHDGRGYLVESFCNVIITPASLTRLLLATKKQWTGAGFGVTQAHENFKPLPAVQEELSGIIRNPDNLNAVLEGTLRLDADFNWASMKQDLAEHHPAVHIASHFRLSPYNNVESYLLLGDGEKLTLDLLQNQQYIFGGVDLLTLSACDTAVVSGTGKELDSFSMIAQRLGAKSVIASLWGVEDSSTSPLMQEFYRLRESGVTKGEALRRVQVKMLNGEIGVNANSVSRGESLFRYEKNPDKPYSHPYFWAPFVLIGNYL